MGIFIFIIIMLAVLFGVVHFWTTSRLTDGMGAPEEEYRKFLTRKGKAAGVITEIPAPPDGKRDPEVEGLLLRGNYQDARGLLEHQMEQARLAPVGSAARIARVSHYMEILNRME